MAISELEKRVNERTAELERTNILLIREMNRRISAEETLRKSEEKFKAQYKGIPVPTYTWKSHKDDFVLIDFNDAASALYSGGIEELRGSSLGDLFPGNSIIPTEFSRCISERIQVKSEGDFNLVSYQERRQFLITYVPVAADLIMVHTEDVTVRRQTERQLLQAAQVFESTSEGIIIADAHKQFVAVNTAFTNITGFEKEDIVGVGTLSQYVNDAGKFSFRKILSELKKNGRWKGVTWKKRKNGELFPAWENISVVKDEQGNINSYVILFSDITDIKKTEDRLSHLAHHDALTGLPNRLLFNASLEHTLKRAKRNKKQFALLYLDLDRFKHINDTMGHSFGDHLLKVFAGRLSGCVRAEDTVARVGGDEFIVILTEISHAEDAAILAEKLVNTISRSVMTESGKEYYPSTSVGISVYPGDGVAGEELTKAADTAMYYAKNKGTNSIQFYTNELTLKVEAQALLEKELKSAIKNNEFRLFYHPQISVRTGRIVGIEALLRWDHPNRGILKPEDFLLFAVETGLIAPIGEWVLRSALDMVGRCRSLDPSFGLTVNFSGRQFTDEKCVSKLFDILNSYQCGTKYADNIGSAVFDIEITENDFQNLGWHENVFEKFKSLGVTVSIDDFGTGYSSFSQLKNSPISRLKISKKFVKDIIQNSDSRDIVSAIIAMGHQLKLKITCGGIETNEQMELLRALGCDEIQGHLYGEPMPENRLVELLALGDKLIKPIVSH